MSLEQSPSGGYSLHELAQLCEAAYLEENWDAIEGEFDYSQLGSVRLCADLRAAFEFRYHLLRQPNAVHATEKPDYLSPIRFTDPYINIPGGRADGSDIRMQINGDPPFEYLDIMLHAVIDTYGEEYIGPHLVGILDTEILEDEQFAELDMEPGEYTFVSPIKDLQVSDCYIPTLFN